LPESSLADKTATVIRKIFQIVLWLVSGAYAAVGVLAVAGALNSSHAADSLDSAYLVFGFFFLMIGATRPF
jgi:hypothetical protein